MEKYSDSHITFDGKYWYLLSPCNSLRGKLEYM